MSKKPATIQGEKRTKMALTVAFTVIAIVYLLPVFLVLVNSFKSNAYVNTDTFALPNEESFVGMNNYIKGMTFGNYPFAKSVVYLHGSLVHRPGGQYLQQDRVLPLRFLHGGALPDGHVYPAQNR